MRGLVVGARFILLGLFVFLERARAERGPPSKGCFVLRGVFVFWSGRGRNGGSARQGLFCFTRVIRFLERARAERGLRTARVVLFYEGYSLFVAGACGTGAPHGKGCFVLRGLFAFWSGRVRSGGSARQGVFCFTRVIRFLERARAERGLFSDAETAEN
ncbi:hypothetical protein TRSA_18680 [Treponema saccharophilum]|nr:hypothetical protein TRSA_18680 [Treponema saccharophilum]